MPQTMTQDEIFTKVSNILVSTLAVDEGDVVKEATLKQDLGAESIDFLDIGFKLEKNFGIKIPKGELFPDEKLFDNPQFVQGGKFTAAGLEELKARMPFADLAAFSRDPALNRLNELYTVDTIVRYIDMKLSRG